mmetsp:Transcript_28305/g.74900  ORF Transcript_28305/g.74900 Transcript_28305/m.74900 type:complete len:201 (+) Transcript_28305:428-1030(+)
MEPTTDETLMMRPHLFLVMALRTALVMRKTELRLVSMTSSHWVSFMRIIRVSLVMPALLTRMSTLPYSASMTFSTEAISALSTTSSFMPVPVFLSLKRAAMAAAPESEVAVPITMAPAAASFLAMASPMPRDAPVTRATLPVRSKLGMPAPAAAWRATVERRGAAAIWPATRASWAVITDVPRRVATWGSTAKVSPPCLT